MTDEPTDAELLARIKTDPAAVELIFRRYFGDVSCPTAKDCITTAGQTGPAPFSSPLPFSSATPIFGSWNGKSWKDTYARR